MPARIRARQEFQDTPRAVGPQLATLASFSGGYNGYTSPEILSPQFWAQASNCYSGQFGTVRRARFAPIVSTATSGYAAQGTRFSSLFSFRDQTPQDILLGDIGNTIWSFNVNGNYAATQITDGFTGLASSSAFSGPWSRTTIGGIAFGMNGQIKRQWRGAGLSVMENLGIDTPDTAPGTSSTTSPTVSAIAENAITSNPGGVVNVSGVTVTWVSGTTFTTGSSWNNQVITINGVDCVIQSVSSTTSLTLKAQDGTPIPTGSNLSYGINALAVLVTMTSGLSGAQLALVFFGGQKFTIAGVGVSGYNGAFGVSTFVSKTNKTFVYYLPVGTTGLAASSGGTLGAITKTVGRSYQYAWENANTGHVSAPSPASSYALGGGNVIGVGCFEAGFIITQSGSATISGVGTAFTAAWVGRKVWIDNGNPPVGEIASVQSPTMLTLTSPATSSFSSGTFQGWAVIDSQATHLRLYATGDGQAVYFRIQRNVLNTTTGGDSFNDIPSGFVFYDADDSEPPDGEFTSEITQVNNLPPPIGTFIDQYQSRNIVYGVPGGPSSFFYSNFETTSIGVPYDSFAPLNQVTLPMGDAKLFGTANLPTAFILWSSKQDMFKLTGNLTDNTVATDTQLGATVQRLPYKIGCASPFAVAVTSLGVIWLSSDRQVWLFTDNYAPKNIGQPIQDILNTVNGARLPFAKMKVYKNGDRNWLELSVAIGTSTFNNKKLVLDLSLLASNGSPSFFTFDMATNQPSWYPYDVNCEAVEVTPDSGSNWHTLSGDVDLITETDWQAGYYTVSAEQSVQGSIALHALGNEAPEIVKSLVFMRCNTNQLPKYLASQGWKWNVLAYDDDAFVLGVNPNIVSLIPATDSAANVISLENSPASFRFGGVRFALGRRFQLQTVFPSLPGLWEMRSFQVQYMNLAAR